MQWRPLLALTDLFVINRPYTLLVRPARDCVPLLRARAVRLVLVQFVVDMCMLEPMPAARDHAVRALLGFA